MQHMLHPCTHLHPCRTQLISIVIFAAVRALCVAFHIAEEVRVCTAGDSEHELSGFTPSFLWLLRDFYLSLEEDGRKVLLWTYHDLHLQSG